jgi:hypothetical protein
MPKYVLFLHENPSDFADVSPEEAQRIIERYAAWSRDLGARRVGGQKLREEGGRHLSRSGSGVQVSDGPYGEAKEVLGGFFIIDAPDYDAAVEVASGCPHMDFGWIEVREVEPTP